MGFSNDMSNFGTDLTAAGGIVKAGSQIAAGDTRAKLEMVNSEIASQQTKSELEAGGYNANLARQKGQQITGQQVANIGANNLTQGGTNAQVVASTAQAQELNALTIQNNALRRAWGFSVQGASDRFQAGLARRGGMLSGVGSLIDAAGGTYESYMKNNPSDA